MHIMHIGVFIFNLADPEMSWPPSPSLLTEYEWEYQNHLTRKQLSPHKLFLCQAVKKMLLRSIVNNTVMESSFPCIRTSRGGRVFSGFQTAWNNGFPSPCTMYILYKGMLRYRTEIQDAGMPMPAASTSMPMPSYDRNTPWTSILAAGGG